MIEKIRALKTELDDIRERSRNFNMKLSGLNGVAAVIPKTRTYPLNGFQGSKVLLHNVHADYKTGELYAVITLPYGGEAKAQGHKILVNINENWFS